MLSGNETLQLIQSMIWLLAGVGVFIVGMNFMSDALEKSAGGGMKRLLEKISNNRFSGVGIGAGVTAIIQSSSATSVMVIGLVNAGVMTLMQATPHHYGRKYRHYGYGYARSSEKRLFQYAYVPSCLCRSYDGLFQKRENQACR